MNEKFKKQILPKGRKDTLGASELYETPCGQGLWQAMERRSPNGYTYVFAKVQDHNYPFLIFHS